MNPSFGPNTPAIVREQYKKSKEALKEHRISLLSEAVDCASIALEGKLTHDSIPLFLKFAVNYASESSKDVQELYKEFLKTNLPVAFTRKIISSLDFKLESSSPSRLDIKDKLDELSRRQRLYEIIDKHNLSEFDSKEDYKTFFLDLTDYFISGASPIYYLLMQAISQKGLEKLRQSNKEDSYESITYSGYLSSLYDEKGNYNLRKIDAKQKLVSSLDDILEAVSTNPRIVKEYGLRYKDLFDAFKKNGLIKREGLIDQFANSFFLHGEGLYGQLLALQKEKLISEGRIGEFNKQDLSFDNLLIIHEKTGLFSNNGLLDHLANSYFHIYEEKIGEILSTMNLFMDNKLDSSGLHGLLHEKGLFGKEGVLKTVLSSFLDNGQEVYNSFVFSLLEDSIQNPENLSKLKAQLDFSIIKRKFKEGYIFEKQGALYYISEKILENIEDFKADGKLNRNTTGLFFGALKGAILINEYVCKQDKETNMNQNKKLAYLLGMRSIETQKSPKDLLLDVNEHSRIAKNTYGSIDNYFEALMPFKEIETGLVFLLKEVSNRDWTNDFVKWADYLYHKEIEEQNALGFIKKAAEMLDIHIKENAMFFAEFFDQKNRLYQERYHKLLNA